MHTTLNYSPNFDIKKRKSKDIKFIIFHYTGMKNDKDTINRLTDSDSKVSCHYLIKINGQILTLVPDLYVAWHAGVSSWKKYKFLIKKYNIQSKFILGHSDISPDRKKDPGEKFPWHYLSKKKIGIWHNLNEIQLIKTRGQKIKKNDKNIFIKNLNRIGYPKNLNKKRSYLNFLTIAFQRRFRQQLINGIVDKECLLLSKNIVKKFK